MNKRKNTEAAETVQATSVPAVDLPRLVRLSVVPVMMGKDEWVTCPTCGFRELRSGGWPGNESQDGWRCSCDECGQHLTIKDVIQMGLCEVPHIMLRPDQLYRFVVMPGCEKCADAAKPYLPNATAQTPPDSGTKDHE